MKLGKKKSVEYKLVAASCSSYLLGIVCLTVFGYFMRNFLLEIYCI